MKYRLEPDLEEIIDFVYKETNIPKAIIRDCVWFTFKGVASLIRSATKNKAETFKSVRIANLGMFRRNRKVPYFK